MKKLIYITASLFFLFSCTKGGGNMYVEGRVYNPITNEGIKGIKIQLWKYSASSSDYGPSKSKKMVETVYTDADGHYEIKHTGIFQRFYLEATDCGDNYPLGWVDITTKKKTYPDVLPVNGVKIVKSKNMHADFRVVPYGAIQLNIHNINCIDTTDHFILYSEGTQAEPNNSGLMLDKYGCYQLNTSGYSKVPMGERYYRWTVTKSGTMNTYYDTISIAEGEYKTYTIDY